MTILIRKAKYVDATFITDRDVYITTDLPKYFERLGFKRIEHDPEELVEKLKRVCKSKCREEAVAMVYRKVRKSEVNTYGD